MSDLIESWPSWVFHPTQPAQIVASQEALDALGDDAWRNVPYPVPEKLSTAALEAKVIAQIRAGDLLQAAIDLENAARDPQPAAEA